MGNPLMLKHYLIKTKVYFSLSMLMLIGMVVGFSIFLKGFFYLYAQGKIWLDSYQYEVSYAESTNHDLLSSMMLAMAGDSVPVQTPVNGYADSVPVLLYHGIVSRPNGTDVTVETFKEQMFALKQAGYQTITMNDFENFVNGRKKVPAKSFLLTFDDGRKDSYYPVDPILRALNYNAVMFVITRYSMLDEAGPYYLSLPELRNLLASGRWELESHTRDGHTFYNIDSKGTPGHFYSDRLWLLQQNRQETVDEFHSRIHDDFVGAYQDLKNALGVEAHAFAYPFGDFGQSTDNFPDARRVVPQETSRVYPIAFYQSWIGEGFTDNFPNTEAYLKKRLDVRPTWSAGYLKGLFDSGEAKPLPYSDTFDGTTNIDWVLLWGSTTMSGGNLSLETGAFNNGTAVLLNGSYLWDDYSVETSANWVSGAYATIFGRMHDPENYVSCEFGEGRVFINQRTKDNDLKLAETKDVIIPNPSNVSLGMRVQGDTVTCLINGIPITYSNVLTPLLRNGGIGFKVWDQKNGNANLILRGVQVDPL